MKMRRLFLASFLGWVINLLGSMSDGLIAGANLDADAVAAVELIDPIYNFLYFISMIISLGCAVMYSRELGAFRVKHSEEIAGTGLMVSIGMGLVLAGCMFVFKQNIIEFYGCSEAISNYASEYFDAYIGIALFYPPMWLLYFLVDYDGDEVSVFFVDISYTIVNLGVSLFLVAQMGIKGLAIGTMVSEFVGLLILIPHFFKKNNSIHFKLKFSWKDLKDMLIFSSSSASTILFVAVTDIIFNKFIIEFFSEDYIPAYTVVNALLNIAGVFGCAKDAGGVIISVSNGEENPYAIKRMMKVINKLTVWVSLGFTVVILAVASYWPDLYGIEDPAVAQAAITAGRIIPITFILASFVYTYLGYYCTIEKPIEGNILSVAYMLVGPVVLAIPMAKLGGFTGLAWGFALTPAFSLLVLLLYFVISKKIKNAPLLLQDTDEIEAHFDIYLDEPSIVMLRDKVEEFLKESHVSGTIINEIKIILEDSLVYIMKKNTKKVCCECIILVNQKHVRIMTRDNGVIFDMLEEADSAKDLRCYVLGRMMDQSSEKSNTTTISFNRNTYIWEY